MTSSIGDERTMGRVVETIMCFVNSPCVKIFGKSLTSSPPWLQQKKIDLDFLSSVKTQCRTEIKWD